jgi:hypothetical protein
MTPSGSMLALSTQTPPPMPTSPHKASVVPHSLSILTVITAHLNQSDLLLERLRVTEIWFSFYLISGKVWSKQEDIKIERESSF